MARAQAIARAALVVTAIATATAGGCDTPGAQIRRAADRGDVRGALGMYASHLRARGASDPDALTGVALAVLRRAAASDDAHERDAGFAELRSLGIHGRDTLADLARTPGVVGDRAAASLFDVEGHEGGPPPRLLAALHSDDVERRVAGLAWLEARHDAAGLIAALGDVAPDVRRGAAARLGRRGSGTAPAATALGEHALHDPELLVRLAAIYALGEQGAPAAPWLEQVMADPDTTVKMAAVYPLALASRARAVAVLAPLLARPPSTLSLEAARVLAGLGNRVAAGYILGALEDPSAALRAQAAVDAAGLGEGHEQPLAAHIEDADVEVQLRVASLFARNEPYRERVIRALRPIARRPDPIVAVRALGVLAQAGDPQAAAPLRGALAAPDPTVRRLAAAAWSALAGTSGEVDPLAPLLEDRDLAVRLSAAAEIVRIASR